MTRARWLGVAALLGLTRWWMADGVPWLVHPIDPAELKFAELYRLWAGGGADLGAVSRLLGAAQNVHHGGFLPVSMLYALLASFMGDGIGALRAVAALTGALTWWVWVQAAGAVGGQRVAVGMAAVMILLPPWAQQWWLTPWGSHPEAAVFTGLWVWALADGGDDRWIGGWVGMGMAWTPMLWPTGLLALALARSRRSAVAAVVGFGVLAGPRWLLGGAGLTESLVENPALTMQGVVVQAFDGGALVQALATHLPLPLVASSVVPASAWVNGLLSAGVVIAGAVVLVGRQKAGRLLVLAPLVHWATVVVLSPLRPTLHHRYLLPWLPAVLLLPLWAGLLDRRWRPLLGVSVVVALSSLPVTAALLTGRVPTARSVWAPWSFQQAGLDRVTPGRADAVATFLARRSAENAPLEGFSEAFSRRSGYPVWGEPFPDQGIEPQVQGQLEHLWQTSPTAERKRQLGENVGWGLWIASDGQRSVAEDAARRLGRFSGGALRGIAEAAAVLENRNPPAPGSANDPITAPP